MADPVLSCQRSSATMPTIQENVRTIPVASVGTVRPELVARAVHAFASRPTLADVLQWAREQEPPRQVSEIVTQDEYTHDVVLPFEGGHFLVFDAT